MNRLIATYLGAVDVPGTPESATAGQDGTKSELATHEPVTAPELGLSSEGDVAAATVGALVIRTATDRVVAKLECNRRVRERLDQRLDQFPIPSAREAKRLLTTWQFCIRVLTLTGPPVLGVDETTQARAAVLLAEISVRWPALLPNLVEVTDSQQNISRLHAAARADDITWTRAAAKAGLDRARDEVATTALRALLLEDDGHIVPELATRLF